MHACLRGSMMILFLPGENTETATPHSIIGTPEGYGLPHSTGLEHCLAQPLVDAKKENLFSLAVANGNVFHMQASSVRVSLGSVRASISYSNCSQLM